MHSYGLENAQFNSKYNILEYNYDCYCYNQCTKINYPKIVSHFYNTHKNTSPLKLPMFPYSTENIVCKSMYI